MKKRTVRTVENDAKYKAYLAEKRAGCPFCFQDGLERVITHKFKYWYITENLFPYDKDYSKNSLIVPFRHLVSFWDLNEQEMAEYLEIRKQLVGMDFDELLENMPRERTQIHFHQHLLRY